MRKGSWLGLALMGPAVEIAVGGALAAGVGRAAGGVEAPSADSASRPEMADDQNDHLRMFAMVLFPFKMGTLNRKFKMNAKAL